MPPPVSRTVATIRFRAGATAVVISIRPPRAGRGDRLLRVHHHVQEHLVQQQRIALHARQFLVIVSHDFDVERAAGRRSQRHDLLQHAR